MREYTSLSYTMHDKGKKKVNIKSKEFVMLVHIHVWTLYVCSVVLNPIRHRYIWLVIPTGADLKRVGVGVRMPLGKFIFIKIGKNRPLNPPPPVLGIPLPWKNFWMRNSLKHTYKILLLKKWKIKIWGKGIYKSRLGNLVKTYWCLKDMNVFASYVQI